MHLHARLSIESGVPPSLAGIHGRRSSRREQQFDIKPERVSCSVLGRRRVRRHHVSCTETAQSQTRLREGEDNAWASFAASQNVAPRATTSRQSFGRKPGVAAISRHFCPKSSELRPIGHVISVRANRKNVRNMFSATQRQTPTGAETRWIASSPRGQRTRWNHSFLCSGTPRIQ